MDLRSYVGFDSIVKQARSSIWHGNLQMSVSEFISHAPASGAADKTQLEKVRLDHVNKRINLFVERRSHRLYAHRPTLVNADHRRKKIPVKIIQALFVDAFELQSLAGHPGSDPAIRLYVRIIAHAPEQAVGDAWGSARPLSDFSGAGIIDGDIQDLR